MRWVIAFILNIFWGFAVEAISDFNLIALAVLVIGSLIITFKLVPSIGALMGEIEIEPDDFYF